MSNVRILDLQQQILESNDTHLHRAAELELERLERRLAAAERSEAAYQERETAIHERRTERECEARRGLEEELMQRFIESAPGTTRREAKKALPKLLEQYRLDQMADQERRPRSAAYRV